MPSPVGHVMAGITVALLARPFLERVASSPSITRLAILSAAAACAPDFDLLFWHGHRRATHSLFAVALVGVTTMLVARVLRRQPVVVIGVVIGCAYGTHLLLDWLGEDMGPPAGIQALWPWTDEWFVSGTDLFDGIDRDDLWSIKTIRANVAAVLREIVLLGPLCYLAGRLTRRSRPRADRP